MRFGEEEFMPTVRFYMREQGAFWDFEKFKHRDFDRTPTVGEYVIEQSEHDSDSWYRVQVVAFYGGEFENEVYAVAERETPFSGDLINISESKRVQERFDQLGEQIKESQDEIQNQLQDLKDRHDQIATQIPMDASQDQIQDLRNRQGRIATQISINFDEIKKSQDQIQELWNRQDHIRELISDNDLRNRTQIEELHSVVEVIREVMSENDNKIDMQLDESHARQDQILVRLNDLSMKQDQIAEQIAGLNPAASN
jgi:polyhydroxyalkanoate synthesis regulator phasin